MTLQPQIILYATYLVSWIISSSSSSSPALHFFREPHAPHPTSDCCSCCFASRISGKHIQTWLGAAVGTTTSLSQGYFRKITSLQPFCQPPPHRIYMIKQNQTVRQQQQQPSETCANNFTFIYVVCKYPFSPITVCAGQKRKCQQPAGTEIAKCGCFGQIDAFEGEKDRKKVHLSGATRILQPKREYLEEFTYLQGTIPQSSSSSSADK